MLPVFHKTCNSRGICKISHLLDESGNLLGYDVMQSNFQDLHCLEFCGIILAVKLCLCKAQNEPMDQVESTEGVTITKLKSQSKIDNFTTTSQLKKSQLLHSEI